MKPLQKFWFSSSPIDLEHKQYILLDFLQSVKDDFTLDVLYPWLSEVQNQHADLSAFKHERDMLREKFKTMKKFNFETNEVEYEYDNSWITKDFEEIAHIVDFSMPKLNQWMDRGRMFFDDVSNQMKWDVVGLTPGYKDEGYFILHVDEQDIFIYRFKVEKIIFEDENFFGMSTEIIDFFNSRIKHYEDLKLGLIKKHDLPFPFTLSIQTKSYPLKETLVPVMKRVGLTRIKNSF